MTRLLLILVLAFSGVGMAEVTAAWKVPIESRIPDYETDERVRKLAKPPGESAFFEAGDEIWEVSKALRWVIWALKVDEPVDPFAEAERAAKTVRWQGEWVVWNARSGMFVARGSWTDIQIVEEILGIPNEPIVLRSRIDVAEGDTGGDSKPGNFRSLSIVSRSGYEAKAEVEGVEVDFAICASVSEGVSDAVCDLSWPAEANDRRWHVHTGVTVREEVRTRLARHGNGPGSWEVYLTVSRELPDGTPVAELRWIETAIGMETWIGPGRKDIRETLGPNRELGIYPVPEHFLSKLGGEEVVPTLPDVEAPAELAEWVRGPLMDIEKLLRENGVKIDLAAGHFAGFDPRSNSVIFVADLVNQDIAEQIFSHGCSSPSPLWIETSRESGGWGLASRSGEKAGISRRSGDVTDLLFEIEPTLGGNREIMDLRYKFDVVAGDRAIGRIESATTLYNGKPVRVATYTKEGMEDLEVILTGAVTGK